VTLHKYVETEPVSEDVELQHETARVERQPVNRPLRPGEDVGEDEATLRLKREEPVVEKSARAKEEFYVAKESEPTTERVTGEVQKERVDVENDDGTPRP
jgi:stress response protein YsnF